MRALLDVNVLIALLDADHISHQTAVQWFAVNAPQGWASCAITQNGCVRIMSSPNYPNARSVHEVTSRLREATSERVHEFWPSDITLLDERLVDSRRVHSARQLTDVYLLALAVAHAGRLVTFHQSIAIQAVTGASPAHLLVL